MEQEAAWTVYTGLAARSLFDFDAEGAKGEKKKKKPPLWQLPPSQSL